MNEISEKLELLKQECDEKKQKKYKIQIFINLSNILDDEKFSEMRVPMVQSYELLYKLVHDETLKPKEYRKSFTSLQKEVRKKYGFTAEGQIRAEHTGMGIAIGVALGGAFVSINPAFVGIGIPIGLAIGAGIGDKKEKEAVEQGKVY
jgi:hypothetical protein